MARFVRQTAAHAAVTQHATRRMLAILRFWYDFIVGDDWLVAAGVVAGLGLTYAVSQAAVPAWWLMPVAVGALLPVSLRRVARRR